MAQSLADQFGGSQERAAPVARVGYIDEGEGEESNVMAAFSAEGDALFQFAWRPHKPSPESNNYTDEGLFIC
jgi:hypothetical protein